MTLRPKRVRRRDGKMTTVYVRDDAAPADSVRRPLSAPTSPAVDIAAGRPLTARQMQVFQTLSDLGQIVPSEGWCLIGGLMVDVVLRQRGATMLRPTEDGDIVGDVVADRSVLRRLAHGLHDLGYHDASSTWDDGINTRYQHRETGVYVDLLAPDNTSKLRRVVPPRPGKVTLQAPGTDFALVTATPVSIRQDDREFTVRVPSLRGALYAKATAWKRLGQASNPTKHLQDAAQLLAVATPADFTDLSPAERKRFVWLLDELQSSGSEGWAHIAPRDREDVVAGLRRMLR